MTLQRVEVVDSHTEGEPTRVVVRGGPELGGGSVAAQARVFRERFDVFRSAVVNEPRGGDAWVGALMVPPASPHAICGVIFFNNVGLLHSCGHGTIGLGATLAHLGKIQPGRHVVETPVGDVAILLDAGGSIGIENVPAYRHAHDVAVDFEWNGRKQPVQGDIAWGGNWFFLVSEHGQSLELRNIETLTQYAWSVRQGLEHARITGRDGGVIDHIELFGPPVRPDCDSRNFVLCPGKAYDRSPCGTGTSAKMACLFADGKLAEGEEWRQESIIGSRFVGVIRRQGELLIPTIQGHAYITAESTLLFDDRDPFRHGIQA
jgi:4-hydroxyproline epimerase